MKSMKKYITGSFMVVVALFVASPMKASASLLRAYSTPATSITQTSAVLNGYIEDAGGAPTVDLGFDWGLSSTRVTAFALVGRGFSTTRVPFAYSYNLTGLTCNTDYYYLAHTYNGTVVAYSSENSFRTLPCTTGTPPVVTTLPVTGITVLGGVVLNGRLNLMGTAPSVTVGFNYGTTTLYGTTTTVPAPRTTVGTFTNPYTITGLPCGTTYHVQAFAVSTAGTSYGADVPFNTVACVIHTVVAPTVVTNSASSISRTGVVLNGNLTSLGGATTTTVGFQLGTTTLYGTTMTVPAPRTGPGAFTNPTTISTLAPNTLYHYRTFATNSAGTVYGADVTFTTLQ